MSKKPIIVFEGIEGSGKSHHISKVSKYLKERNINHVKIREPGGNANSEKIRKLILNNKSDFNQNTDLLFSDICFSALRHKMPTPQFELHNVVPKNQPRILAA